MNAIAASSLQNSSSTMTPANNVTSLELTHTQTPDVISYWAFHHKDDTQALWKDKNEEITLENNIS